MNDIATETSADYGAITAPETVRIERLLPGPIERVWAYLVEPEKRKLWFADGPMEPSIGGAVELIWRNSKLSKGDVPAPDGFGDANGEARGRGTVTAYDPPHRLGFTWAHTGDPETEAVFELSPRGDKVMLVITHRRLTTNGLVLGVSAGWHTHLEILRAQLEDHEPPKFWATFGRMREVYRRRYGF
jgi:uncharacterized protein YndB with AHSA1/START domain